jgi:hypothetical protein
VWLTTAQYFVTGLPYLYRIACAGPATPDELFRVWVVTVEYPVPQFPVRAWPGLTYWNPAPATTSTAATPRTGFIALRIIVFNRPIGSVRTAGFW